MRIVFFGTAAFAVPSLERLAQVGKHAMQCVTQPTRPQGRGLVSRDSPVHSAATRLGLPIEEPIHLQSSIPSLQRVQPDLGVVISYGHLIPSTLLRLPRHGMLGVHPSLLPKYRGASPIVSTILNADSTTGVTIFRLNDRWDAGEIALQRELSVEPQNTAVTLSQRLAVLGAELLLEAVEGLERGTLAFRSQEERLATYTPKLTKADGQVDWHAPASSIDRLIRATTPWPGATTQWRGQSLRLWAAHDERQDRAGHGRPGEVVSVSPDGMAVATGEGILMIEELQLASRRRMTVQAFLVGHSMKPGEILGEEQGAKSVAK
ncbi:MAG: methionyl-tRNA formyltransferase [Candidatus Omnitrophica bacterium]|nr:methionyl-tRNA formyltransferase [Candidatus Omnitrophota bacterium]